MVTAITLILFIVAVIIGAVAVLRWQRERRNPQWRQVRDFRRSLLQGGLLPCERRGVGLVMLVGGFGAVIAGAVLTAVGWSGAPALVFGGVLTNTVNSLRSDRWLRSQPGHPQTVDASVSHGPANDLAS